MLPVAACAPSSYVLVSHGLRCDQLKLNSTFRRGHRLAFAFAVVTMSVLGGASAAYATEGPTLAAKPARGLGDGQSGQAPATGVNGDTAGLLTQCAQGESVVA